MSRWEHERSMIDARPHAAGLVLRATLLAAALVRAFGRRKSFSRAFDFDFFIGLRDVQGHRFDSRARVKLRFARVERPAARKIRRLFVLRKRRQRRQTDERR